MNSFSGKLFYKNALRQPYDCTLKSETYLAFTASGLSSNELVLTLWILVF
jgi:hypothetical protein